MIVTFFLKTKIVLTRKNGEIRREKQFAIVLSPVMCDLWTYRECRNQANNQLQPATKLPRLSLIRLVHAAILRESQFATDENVQVSACMKQVKIAFVVINNSQFRQLDRMVKIKSLIFSPNESE